MSASNVAAALTNSEVAKPCGDSHGENDWAKQVPKLNNHAAGPPLYRRRPDTYCEKTAKVTVSLGDDLCNLLQVAAEEPLFLDTALAAATSACLYRYTRSSPIAIATPAMVREGHASSSEQLAILVTDIQGSMGFQQLFLVVRETLAEARRKGYPLPLILAEAGERAVHNRCPFFDVALVMADSQAAMPEARHDVTLVFSYQPGQSSLHAVFSPELYETETIHRFCRHILQILQSGLEDRNAPICQLTLLDEAEKRTLTVEWNATQAEYPKDRCVHELFEDHAAQFPHRTALVCGAQRLSYRELNEKANQLAHYLLRMDITPDTPIGLFFNRSVEQVIGVLGVLKAGAAYVPYDPAYPKDRLAAMFEDLKLKAVLTSESLVDRLPDAETKRICLDTEAGKIAQESAKNPKIHPASSHLCYIVFTSGSTGRAKATAVYHGGWMNLMHWFVCQFDITPSDRTLVMSSISFDITQRAMAMPLISGGELHLLASDHYEPELILSTLENAKITLMNCAPSTFYPLVEGPEAGSGYRPLRSLRWLILGGEGISASRLKMWATSSECGTRIANVYGAAECSDVSSYYVLHDFDRYIETSVPIGRHIYNTQIYLLDEYSQLVPLGVAGEIFLAGDGVGKGYVNDPALTARKFPANPFASDPNQRMYRTGDLARYLPDGNLEFMGRVDNQVKIRGQRVELGEIDTILRQQESVKEAVVIQAQSSGDSQWVVAYVVPRQPVNERAQPELIDQLRATLTSKLPQYMVPNAFVILSEMPLNPNGKIDRAALPQPAAVRGRFISDPPRTETEKTLADIFARVLKVQDVGVDDNFFSLGGQSLLVTQILDGIAASLNVEFPALEFFKDPSVSAIAAYVDAALRTEDQLRVGV
jgi:amino acid adenylation domain-containing protein